MATEVVVDISGLKEIRQVLGQLPDRLQRNILRGAVRAGALLLQKVARGQARMATAIDSSFRDKGRLAESIELTRRSSRAGDWMVGGIRVASKRFVEVRRTRKGGHRGVVVNPARYWHFFEFGTSERVQRRGKRRTGRMEARYFFRDTIQHHGEDAIAAATDYIRRRIDKELHKLAAAIVVARGGL